MNFSGELFEKSSPETPQKLLMGRIFFIGQSANRKENENPFHVKFFGFQAPFFKKGLVGFGVKPRLINLFFAELLQNREKCAILKP